MSCLMSWISPIVSPPEEQTALQAYDCRGFLGEKDSWLCVIMVDAMVVW